MKGGFDRQVVKQRPELKRQKKNILICQLVAPSTRVPSSNPSSNLLFPLFNAIFNLFLWSCFWSAAQIFLLVVYGQSRCLCDTSLDVLLY